MRPQDYQDLHELEQNLWWFAGMRQIAGTLIDSVSGNCQLRLILDAGCGTGGNLKWLARFPSSKQSIGIDVDREAVHFCRTDDCPVAQASVLSLPFSDQAFDLVTSFDVLSQLPLPGGDQAALREMHRVLIPGGVMFVRVPAYQWLFSDHDNVLRTQRRYALTELIRKVESVGFRVLRATYANSLLFPLAIVRRLLLKRLGAVSRDSDVRPLPFAGLNGMFQCALRFEAYLLSHRGLNLPFGLSAICVAQRLERWTGVESFGR